MSYSREDRDILRGLGEQFAEIAVLPINNERKELHRKINNLEKAKPTIHIYQIPWHEMDVDDELKLKTKDPFCQGIEMGLKRTIYKWNHMQGDMALDAMIVQRLCINDTDFGISEDVDIAKTDENSDVVSRHFNIQIKNEDDIGKIKFPDITYDEKRTEEEYMMQRDIFDGILAVEKCGVSEFWFAPWDEIIRLTGVQEILMDMVLRPDYVNKIIERFVEVWLYRLDKYEKLGLLQKPAMELWGVGAAQIFSEVSPAMHEEFALRHEAKWFERFGLNYYGCCEPLHNKVDIVKKNIPRLRKISMSPWVDFKKAVNNVKDELVFAWKPNPAVLAAPEWQPEVVRRDMEEKLDIAKDCIVEIHMKDISTVKYQPQRLWEWAQIAAEVTEKYNK